MKHTKKSNISALENERKNLGLVQKTGETLLISPFLKRIEEILTKTLNKVEERMMKRIATLEKEDGDQILSDDPDESDSPDAKSYRAMLRKASTEMDSKMEEIKKCWKKMKCQRNRQRPEW